MVRYLRSNIMLIFLSRPMSWSFTFTRQSQSARLGAYAICLAAAVCGFALFARPALADTCTFTQAVDNNFATAGNWDASCHGGAAAPGNGDAVIIPAGMSATTTATAVTVSTTTVLGTLDLDGKSLYTTSTYQSIIVGATGTLNVGHGFAGASGTILTISGGMISMNDANGMIRLMGDWNNSGTLFVGTGTSTIDFNGTGAQTVTNTEPNFPNLIKTDVGTLTLNGLTTVLGGATSTAGTLSAAANALTITGTTFVLAGATVTSTSGVLTFTGAVSSTGLIGSSSGGSVFASTFQNNGNAIFELGSGSSTAVGQITNLGTIKNELGTLHIRANWTNGGTLDGGTGTVELNGAAAQTVAAEPNFYNLTINKSTQTATLSGNVTSTNDLTITSGTLALGANTLFVGGGWSDTGTLSGGTGTVVMYSAGAVLMSAEPNFFNLEKTGAGIITLTGNVIVLGNASSSAGMITTVANALTITGTMLVSSGATVTSTSGVLTFIGAASSTGLIGTNGGGYVFGSTFQNNGTFELGFGSSTAVGQITNVGNIKNEQGTLHIRANWTNDGILTGGTGTVEFNGAAAQTIAAEPNFYNLTIDKSALGATLGANVTSTNNVTITSGTLALGANTLFVGGSWSDTGTLDGGTGTVVMYGASAQTMSAEPAFFKLEKTGAGTLTLSGNVLVLDNASSSAGTLTAGANTLTITGTMLVGSGATVTSTSGVLTFVGAASSTGSIGTNSGGSVFASTFHNNGTFEVGSTDASSTAVGVFTNATSSGVINGGRGTLFLFTTWWNGGTFNPQNGTIGFNGTSAQTVMAIPYYNLNVLTAGTATLAGNASATGTTNVGSGATFAIGANTLTAVGLITNTGTISKSTGKIVHTAESFTFTDSSGGAVASYSQGQHMFITLQDSNANLLGGAVETTSVQITIGSTDTETVTLTETSASSGIFRNTAGPLLVSWGTPTIGNGTLEASDSGTMGSAYTDGQDSADTASASMAFTVTTVASAVVSTGGGGGGGGGGSVTLFNFVTAPAATTNLPLTFTENSLVKLANDGNSATQADSAVYYYGNDGRRHAFPNDKAYFTWYTNFNQVQIVSAAQLAQMPLGTNVTYRPGVRMVKFATLNNVYVVGANGLLRWVKTEAIATALYGATWNKMIDDINDAFYANYRFGTDIATASDFVPSAATTASPTIQVDKAL